MCGVWAPISGPMIRVHGRVSCATCGNPRHKKAFGCLGNSDDRFGGDVVFCGLWTVCVIDDHAVETLFGGVLEDLTLETPKVPGISSMKTWKIFKVATSKFCQSDTTLE